MMLLMILLVPLFGGIVAWVSVRLGPKAPRWVSAGVLAVDFLLVVWLWVTNGGEKGASSPWITEFDAPWIPHLGVALHLGVDGISLILIGLTTFLGCIASIASWREIIERTGLFYLCLLWTITGVLGVFLALDLFLFYFSWELMLVPMFFLIALWGHEDRFRASVKFFIFTQLSGLFMLVSILGLYFLHGRSTGTYTFSYPELLHSSIDPRFSMLLLLGFLAAFLVKMPAVPFHTWLPDAHTQAPTAGSVILAGLLLKTGAYGLFRFAMPIFPAAAGRLSIPLAITGVIGILYGAFLAYSQSDVKRLVAYTSVSHMGFVLLGLSAGNQMALQGAIIQIVSHGLSTGALFILVGALQERLGTRDLLRMGGLWSVMPRLGGATMFFALATLGLPGLGSFVGEFLVVLGAYHTNPTLAIVAAVGFILSTAYALRLMEKVFFGQNTNGWKCADLSAREMVLVALMIVPLLWLGLYPKWFIDRVESGCRPVYGSVQAGVSCEGQR
jgi:NADH-quinone oxidoreductase subunit M